MQTYLWNPWSIFDELERSRFTAAGSAEWPPFDIEDNDGDDPDRVTADIASGELTIRLEKTARARPRRIKLTSGLAAQAKGLLTSDRDKHAA